MKWMIASDIHGSAYYCKRMTERFAQEQADRLLLQGDLLYHGPRNPLPRDYQPQEVIALLSGLQGKIFCVRGNCEAEVDQMVLPFPVLADYALLEIGNKLAFATHGHLFHPDHPPALGKGDLLLYGHTHVPGRKVSQTGNSCLNPGSVSIPKEGSPHSYLIWEAGLWSWRTLEQGEEYQRWEDASDQAE